ncbi:SpaA isopeptide-forming pilin-related protein [Alloscardovia criceti]|uniref:SpaA isopeptide-forming pilin-related protein n=1 Tax=Alloscardovia criceti TaxID=356828 RepID=UPI00039B6D54|nr:SpaA isopeptide-forming pilin-related protein [Alloscardovia criceti]
MSFFLMTLAVIASVIPSGSTQKAVAATDACTVNDSGYSVTPSTANTKYAETDDGYYTFAVLKISQAPEGASSTDTNWYYTYSILRSAAQTSYTTSQTIQVRVRVWYDDGKGTFESAGTTSYTIANTNRQTSSLTMSIPGIGSSPAVNISTQLGGNRAATIAIGTNNGYLFTNVYRYNTETPDASNLNSIQVNVPRLIQQTTNYYDIETNEKIADQCLQVGLDEDTYTTAPININGYTLVKELMPNNQNGTFQTLNKSVNDTTVFYRALQTVQGYAWLKFEKNADATVNVSGWFLHRGGSADENASQPLWDTMPPTDYDFDTNPDNYPISTEPVPQTGSQDVIVPIVWGHYDSNGKQVNGTLLTMPRVLENWDFTWPLLLRAAIYSDDKSPATDTGYHLLLRFSESSPIRVRYYYAKPRFSVSKTTEDDKAILDSSTKTVTRTYQVTVNNVGYVEGTSDAIYDTPSVPQGFSIASVTVDGTQVSAESDGSYKISDGVTLTKGKEQTSSGTTTIDSHQTFTVVVTYNFDSSQLTHSSVGLLEQCQTGETPDSAKGFYNAVTMDNDFDGSANNNACSPGVVQADATWEKVDPFGNDVSGATFTLYGDDVTLSSGSDTYSSVVIADCTVESSCSSNAFQDQDAGAGQFRIMGLPVATEDWAEGATEGLGIYVVETGVPSYYNANEADAKLYFKLDFATLSYRLISRTANGKDTVTSDGKVVNYPNTYTIEWRKGNESNQLIAGARWQITGGPFTTPLEVVDCVVSDTSDCAGQAVDADYYDTDTRDGIISIKLPLGNYTLKEIQAPDGYLLSDATYDFTVTPQGGVINNGNRIINKRIPVPNIPLTGGLGSDMFLIVGGVFVAIAGAFEIVRRKTRSQKRASDNVTQ